MSSYVTYYAKQNPNFGKLNFSSKLDSILDAYKNPENSGEAFSDYNNTTYKPNIQSKFREVVETLSGRRERGWLQEKGRFAVATKLLDEMISNPEYQQGLKNDLMTRELASSIRETLEKHSYLKRASKNKEGLAKEYYSFLGKLDKVAAKYNPYTIETKINETPGYAKVPTQEVQVGDSAGIELGFLGGNVYDFLKNTVTNAKKEIGDWYRLKHPAPKDLSDPNQKIGATITQRDLDYTKEKIAEKAAANQTLEQEIDREKLDKYRNEIDKDFKQIDEQIIKSSEKSKNRFSKGVAALTLGAFLWGGAVGYGVSAFYDQLMNSQKGEVIQLGSNHGKKKEGKQNPPDVQRADGLEFSFVSDYGNEPYDEKPTILPPIVAGDGIRKEIKWNDKKIVVPPGKYTINAKGLNIPDATEYDGKKYISKAAVGFVAGSLEGLVKNAYGKSITFEIKEGQEGTFDYGILRDNNPIQRKMLECDNPRSWLDSGKVKIRAEKPYVPGVKEAEKPYVPVTEETKKPCPPCPETQKTFQLKKELTIPQRPAQAEEKIYEGKKETPTEVPPCAVEAQRNGYDKQTHFGVFDDSIRQATEKKYSDKTGIKGFFEKLVTDKRDYPLLEDMLKQGIDDKFKVNYDFVTESHDIELLLDHYDSPLRKKIVNFSVEGDLKTLYYRGDVKGDNAFEIVGDFSSTQQNGSGFVARDPATGKLRPIDTPSKHVKTIEAWAWDGMTDKQKTNLFDKIEPIFGYKILQIQDTDRNDHISDRFLIYQVPGTTCEQGDLYIFMKTLGPNTSGNGNAGQGTSGPNGNNANPGPGPSCKSPTVPGVMLAQSIFNWFSGRV